MDAIPFVTQVLKGQPLIIITPYRDSVIEIMNILIESIRRSQILYTVYTDIQYPLEQEIDIYDKGPGIILMTTVRDDISYNNIIPIYIVSWGVRDNDLKRYRQWINPDEPMIIRMPTRIEVNPSNIIVHQVIVKAKSHQQETLNITYSDYTLQLPDTTVENGGWITEDVLDNIFEYSPKFTSLIENIKTPCVIYCPYIEKYGLDFINEMVKTFNVPIYSYYKDNNAVARFILAHYGILLIHEIEPLVKLPSEIPIHIVSMTSDIGMTLFMPPHKHDELHIYISMNVDNTITSDTAQYNLLSFGISDSNRTFQTLLESSTELITDPYNNLYVQT